MFTYYPVCDTQTQSLLFHVESWFVSPNPSWWSLLWMIYLFYRIFKWYSLWWCPPPPTDLQETLLNMDCWLKCPHILWSNSLVLLPLIVPQTSDTSTPFLPNLNSTTNCWDFPVYTLITLSHSLLLWDDCRIKTPIKFSFPVSLSLASGIGA